MNKEELSDAVGKIDEDLINEAGAVRESVPVKSSKKPIFIGVLSGLAATAAIVAGVLFIPKLVGNEDVGVADTTAITENTQPTGYVVTTAPAKPAETASAIASEPDMYAAMTERKLSGSSVVKGVYASQTMGESISVKSDLMIELYSETSESDLRSMLKVTPEQPFTLTREGSTAYRLSVQTEFKESSLVKVEVEENGEICDSWAFKTIDDFRVKSCYPADGTESASLDTGIEIEFTVAPSEGDLSQYVTIEPAVEAKLFVRERTLYIVPDDGLEANKGYEVTVKAGLPSGEGTALAEDVSFGFRTTDFDNYVFFDTRSSYSGFAEAFVPGDTACIEIMCSPVLQDTELETHLYRFENADDYFEAIKAKATARWSDNVKIGTAGLPEVFSSKEKPYIPVNSGDGGYYYGASSCFVMLPDKLTEGYYVADVFAGENAEYSLQYLIAVTRVSVYMINVGDDILLYVNDAVLKQPADGATVTIEADGKKITGRVGSDGLVTIPAEGLSGSAVLDISYRDYRYIDKITLTGTGDEPSWGTTANALDDLYYAYLYTDRSTYLPNDTINVWGYLLPKTRTTAIPTEVTVEFADAVANEVKLSDGFFTTTFPLSDYTGGAWLKLLVDDKQAAYRTCYVHEYEKPTYIIDVDAPAYAILPQRDPVDVTVSATYYDGTPAEGVMIKNEEYGSVAGNNTYTTDKDGLVKTSVKYDYTYSRSWKANYFNICFELTGIENTYGIAGKLVPSFLSDTMFTYDYDEASRKLTVYTNSMDFSKAGEFFEKYGTDDVYNIKDDAYEMLKGEGLSIPVGVNITRRWTEKTESGSYYDAIEKRNVKTYNYESKSEELGSLTINTVNGVGSCEIPLGSGSGDDGYYYIELIYTDGLGQSQSQSFSTTGSYGWSNFDTFIDNYELGNFGYDSSSSKLLFLLSAKSTEKHGLTDNDDYGYGSYTYFYEDEKINYDLRCVNKGVNIDGKFLLAVYDDNDIVAYKLFDADGKTEFGLTADKTYIPTVHYTGAYFDGRHIYKCYGGIMQFDPERRRINLKAHTDAEYYDAGDTATVTVRATDISGLPLKGATVQLSVVDEAAFAVGEQTVDILSEMYPFRWFNSANEYVSYVQHTNESKMYGEKGGGGGDNAVRKDFKDTAFFNSAVTDANGNCTFTVKLPDNITTWRATVQAVYTSSDDKLFAGNTKQPVVVTRHVFITPIMQNTFVVGDDVSVSAKAAGISREDPITISISGNGYNETKTIKMQQTANFGKLPAGEYKVLFTAEKNGNKDAAELPLTVAETLLETDIERVLPLSGLSGITPTKYPVDVVFFDKEYMLQTNILYELAGYYGDRNDMKLAAAYAWSVLFPDHAEPVDNMFATETANGLARILPAAEPEVEVTALMCAAAPDSVSRSAVVKKFRELMADEMTIQDRSAAYMGLAAFGEPVMNEVKALIGSGADITAKSGIYLSAALALCGDRQSAYDTYIKYVPEIKVDDSDKDAIKAYIAAGSSVDQTLTRTALITASVLDLPEAEGFARALYSEEPELDSYALQLVVYLEHYVPKTSGNAAFTYKDGGNTNTVKLDRHHPTYISFTKEQFLSADFTVTNGDVVCVARYIGRPDQNDKTPTLKVTKKYSGTFAPGETITVTLHSEANSVIYDVIPSCGRRESRRDYGRLVKLYTDKNGNASYTFTVNVGGEYVTESPVVRNYRTGEWGIGERGTVSVKTDENA